MALDTIFFEFFIQKTHFYEYNSFFLYFSLNALGSKIGEIVNTLTDDQQIQSCLMYIHLTLKELAAIITMKVDYKCLTKIFNAIF
jgi:hypothetical protein